jgi:hypothetical protein
MGVQGGERAAAGEPPNEALRRPGARAGLRIELVEGSMRSSLTRRIAWMAVAPAAEGRVRSVRATVKGSLRRR